jgi:hypothetical protein
MPTFPFPPLPAGVPLDGGSLPVVSVEDVEAEWAPELQQQAAQPVLEAIQSGQTSLFLETQRQSRYAAAQSDPLRATDEYLEEIGEERGCFKQQNEPQESYRARIFSGPAVVDPNDIVAAANAVLAPYTSISCRYAERSDALHLPFLVADLWTVSTSYLFGALVRPPTTTPPSLFYYRQVALRGTSAGSAPAFTTTPGTTVNDGTAVWLCVGAAPIRPTWSSHLFEAADGGGPNIVPNYFDRLYESLASVLPVALGPGVLPIPNRRPPGAMLNADPVGRWFLLRVPDIGAVDSSVAAMYPGTLDVWNATQAYLFGATISVITSAGTLIFRQTALGGTSGSSVPAFPTTSGATVADGPLTWTCLGPAPAAPAVADASTGLFLGGGTSGTNTTFLYAITSTVNDIYNAVIGAVDPLIGQGVRWAMIVDPSLTA